MIKIPIAVPTIGQAEKDAVQSALDSGWLANGPKILEFEHIISKHYQKNFGISCNSGGSALHLALAALDIAPGDEIIIPSLTMIAVANAVLQCGATPVFADSSDAFGNINVQKSLISDKTKAIIIAHAYGQPAMYPEKTDIPIIEDCSQAHYATSNNKIVGSAGIMAIFSFYSNKIITTGEGGIILCNDKKLSDRLYSLRNHAFGSINRFQHESLGFSYRMTEMQAAIGLAQHQQHEKFIEKRHDLRKKYLHNLKKVQAVTMPSIDEGAVPWVMPILVKNRNELQKYLLDNGVETRSYFYPMHLQPHLKQYAKTKLPKTEWLSEHGMYLPLYPLLPDKDLQIVCDLIKTFYAKN